MSGPEDGDFLGRWSARKMRARADLVSEPSPAPERPSDPPTPTAEPVDSATDKTDAEILDELGLPDPDILVKGDDFAAFLRASVPARLRNRALRRLWVSDPVLANLDGLNDYEQDFTDAATVMPGLKTAYQVGRGLLREEFERAAASRGRRPVLGRRRRLRRGAPRFGGRRDRAAGRRRRGGRPCAGPGRSRRRRAARRQ